jgi:hypothetical protein
MQALAGDLGRPWIHTLHPSAAAEQHHWRNLVEYAHRNLLHYMGKIKSPEHFAMVDRIVNYFVHRLNSLSICLIPPFTGPRRRNKISQKHSSSTTTT